ncbi:alpha/beta fold hydrolase [Solimonas terrae]|uniref:Alpha/beta hydrolase n=1 Tax=Solimonas terrae TaxID=1396819 RepID=A0A6M2BS48_9GAMM|nr:alpha/beta hydrolase [Solimonas terrae]NGY05308.1 alpha/beta hydrolase [Solimonas terrae]
MLSTASAYRDLTSPWTSSAGAGPTLRGRRHDGHATCLHFVHGNGFCGGVYWPLLQQLMPCYGLFCHDIEGHGDSDRPDHFAGSVAIARRIAPVIAEQKPGGQTLVGMGHSYGAALTVRAAAENPQLFGALVLLDPILMPTPVFLATRLLAAVGRNPIARGALRRRDRWPTRAQAWARLHDRGIYRGWRDEAFNCFIEHATRDDDGERTLACPTWLEAAIFDHPLYPWQALRQLRCPVLFVYGTQTYPFIAPAARKAGRLVAGIDVRTQPGGHCFMQEDPQRTAATIREFLTTHGL